MRAFKSKTFLIAFSIITVLILTIKNIGGDDLVHGGAYKSTIISFIFLLVLIIVSGWFIDDLDLHQRNQWIIVRVRLVLGNYFLMRVVSDGDALNVAVTAGLSVIVRLLAVSRTTRNEHGQKDHDEEHN